MRHLRVVLVDVECDHRGGGRAVARWKRWNVGSECAWQRPWCHNERRVREGDGRRCVVSPTRPRWRLSSPKDHLHFGLRLTSAGTIGVIAGDHEGA
jgi:hypothetical protein